jgi:hypothetical protein
VPPAPPVPPLLLLDSFSLFSFPYPVLLLLTSHLFLIGSKYSPGVFLFCFVMFCFSFFFPLVAVLSVSSVSLAIDDLAIILFLFL